MSIGVSLEGSPNPKQDKAWRLSKTYDYTICEKYPDRQLNTARFTYNQYKKQLYEYDMADNQLKPIEFDRTLSIKFDTLCR